MQDYVADGVKMSEKLELIFDPTLPSTGGPKETELQREQLKKYRQMDSQLDKIEKQVGIWNPLNRYLTVYQALDALCDKVDALNTSGQIELVGSKAKELNS